ncbi:MAG: hypothetical protein ACRCV9_09995 [Burkholderiaceae bacterium]
MRKSRKRRWTRAQGIAAFQRTTLGDQLVAPESACELSLNAHAALVALTSGQGVGEHFDCLAQTVNISLTLAEAGYGSEALFVIKAAQNALMQMLERHARIGKWGLSGTGLTVLREALNVFDQQIEAATAADVLECIGEVFRRMDEREVLR